MVLSGLRWFAYRCSRLSRDISHRDDELVVPAFAGTIFMRTREVYTGRIDKSTIGDDRYANDRASSKAIITRLENRVSSLECSDSFSK
jgi:hypothetical protein